MPPSSLTRASLWLSQDAFRRAGSRDKSLHIIEGATHIAMSAANSAGTGSRRF
jgi:hypothetical protein